MIGSDVIRGYTDTMLLYLLLERDSYGYALSRDIRDMTEEKYVIKETTLYSAFTRLERQGYITSYPGEQTFGKKRTYYRITPDGRAYYREKCREWRLTKEVISKFIREEYENGDDTQLS